MPRPILPVEIAGRSASAVWMATAASAAASGVAMRTMARSRVVFATRPPQDDAAPPMRSRQRAKASWSAAAPLKPANITVVLRLESIPSPKLAKKVPACNSGEAIGRWGKSVLAVRGRREKLAEPQVELPARPGVGRGVGDLLRRELRALPVRGLGPLGDAKAEEQRRQVAHARLLEAVAPRHVAKVDHALLREI